MRECNSFHAPRSEFSKFAFLPRSPIAQETDWTSGSVWTARKMSLPRGFGPEIVQSAIPVARNKAVIFEIIHQCCFISSCLQYNFSPHDSTTAPSGPGLPHCRDLTITLRHNTLGRTPLDEGSAGRRGLYVTTLRRERHLCSWRDSNPQSQQANGCWDAVQLVTQISVIFMNIVARS